MGEANELLDAERTNMMGWDIEGGSVGLEWVEQDARERWERERE